MIPNYNRTKIIATVGPSSNTYEMLLELVKAGVNLFRFNFSHGTHEQHQKVFEHIHKINRAYKLNIGILADLQGPKIRIGLMESGNDGVEIFAGNQLRFASDDIVGNAESYIVINSAQRFCRNSHLLVFLYHLLYKRIGIAFFRAFFQGTVYYQG